MFNNFYGQREIKWSTITNCHVVSSYRYTYNKARLFKHHKKVKRQSDEECNRRYLTFDLLSRHLTRNSSSHHLSATSPALIDSPCRSNSRIELSDLKISGYNPASNPSRNIPIAKSCWQNTASIAVLYVMRSLSVQLFSSLERVQFPSPRHHIGHTPAWASGSGVYWD